MFNSPLLDVIIGLVFIFLLYSLLATSINEGIATLFGLRARMLKKAIIDGMLAETKDDKWWNSTAKYIKGLFMEAYSTLISKREKPEAEKRIGDKFYEHPLIRNYGSSRLFPNASYIPNDNFSVVIKDILKDEFQKRIDEIVQYKMKLVSNNDSEENTRLNLLHSSDMIKIKEIIEYYGRCYSANGSAPPFSIIDKDTWQIFQLHLQNSFYDIEKFTKKMEDWFDDSMNRASGWYKRQTQVVLFLIGMVLAFTFNVDTIAIAGKLSNDKDARDKLVTMAEQAVEKYKDDPKVKRMGDSNGNIIPDTSEAGIIHNDSIFKKYQAKADSIKAFINGDLKKANDIIALGWGDYGLKKNGDTVLSKYKSCHTTINDEPIIFKTDSIPKKDSLYFENLIYKKHWLKYKVGFIISEGTGGKKFLGFLLTALAICLGSPFWFDLLNKLVKIRAAGKKEETADTGTTTTNGNQQPVILNVNTQTGEEAVG